MSIEQSLERIAAAFERYANALESANGSGTTVIAKRSIVAEPATDVDPPVLEAPQESAPVVPDEPKEQISEQMLREELRQLIVRNESKGKNKGMEKASEILKKFGAKTVGAIKPEDYADIVQLCREDKKKHAAAAAKKA